MSECGEIDKGVEGVESFVGADVAGGASASYVLFSGLHGHAEGAIVVAIRGESNDTSGDLSEVLFFAGEYAEA